MTQRQNLLELKELRVDRGGVPVLDIPSFSLYQNEFVSLIGPNGAGKSTLLLSVLGLMKCQTGTVSYRGSVIGSQAQWLDLRRRTAMVLQDPLLFDATVFDNVASGLNIRGMGRGEIKKRVATYLERFNLAHMAQRSARKLSGGEARRVSLARAFAVEPEVIFFDEPFANLDPPTRQALTDDMDGIIRDRGIAAILVTHDQSEALRMSQRIVVMNGGRIVQQGTPAEVMNHPVNEFVANFVGMETILEGEVVSNNDQQMAVVVAGREVDTVGDVEPGARVYCCIRPENVTISVSHPDQKSSARNLYAGRVTDVASMGPFLRLQLDCGFPLTAYVTRESFAKLELCEGKEVYASFKATSVHLIRRRAA
ncbi:ABC transporter ATP-binding protein [Geomonas subterranea]|uniref:ABC transporter ATP-binding protein n=1 Tax=Geomonas subterranea TaxID=2847989 RepID=A0ABX8LMR5_9BACT|nr:ABC transporter ATP-binding protein [Geomonas subterranea]QXE91614.1 ABC transporter ATP-binding protein [Geomonas subterranea]QXM10295.1 ABC transporter ATP-binding protein [Geomonas subterranea]